MGGSRLEGANGDALLPLSLHPVSRPKKTHPPPPKMPPSSESRKLPSIFDVAGSDKCEESHLLSDTNQDAK